jgi:sugar fermentation stimulation protein A
LWRSSISRGKGKPVTNPSTESIYGDPIPAKAKGAELLWVGLPGQQARALFKVRLNRFAALVEYKNEDIKVHVPNSGRLRELLLPGTPVFLTPREGGHRKTAFDLSFAPTPNGQHWVCIDSRVPNLVVAEASCRQQNPLYPGCYLVQREPPLGESRLDFLFDGEAGPLYVEAKCVTLVTEGNIARFPDAPTERGRRHLQELTRLVQGGGRGGVLFLVQRPDALAFSPHDAMDPSFGKGLRQAVAAGVQVQAWTCQVNPGRIVLKTAIPVLL